MGCGSSKPSDPFETQNKSQHNPSQKNRRGSQQVKSSAPTVPDFGLGEHYTPIKLLGEGGTGTTWLCKDIKTAEEVAIKFIKRPIAKVILPMLMHEIQIQGDLGEGHLNIINAREVLLTHSHLALVMECAAGGTMTAHVSDRWDTVKDRGGLFLTEDEARYFFLQFLSAVEYCHSNHVVHRDLKLDNTLLDNKQPPRIKICDFGFARNWDDECSMFTQIGTPVYMSPQLISVKTGKVGYDGRKADVWASGVLLFVMLLGMFPFDHKDHPDPNTSAAYIEVWLQQIRSSWRENPRVAEAAMRLSEECRDLLDKIFDLDESSRLDVEGIKAHPWYNKPLPPHLQEAFDQLRKEQHDIDTQVLNGAHRSAQRDQALKNMLQLAAQVATPTEKITRVSLTRVQSRYTLLEDSSMFPIMEDSSHHSHQSGSRKSTVDLASYFADANASDSAGNGSPDQSNGTGRS